MNREEKKKELIDLIEPLIEQKGLELVQLEYVTGKHGQLHLIIDHPDGIGLEHCEEVSRLVSAILDEQDPIDHAYSLEVSSPGLERPLTKSEHFICFQGEKVKLIVKADTEGTAKVSGTLQQADQNEVTILQENGQVRVLSYQDIVKANLWYPKPSHGEDRKAKRKGG